MIERLLEPPQAARRSAGIPQCIANHVAECFLTHVVRAGERGEQSVARKQFKRADVQFFVAAHRIVQTALRFSKRGRIENDQIILCFRLFGRAQKLKYILLNPAGLELISLRVFPRGRDAFAARFYRSDLRRARASTGESEWALIRETIEHTLVLGVLRHYFVIL